MTTHFRDEAKDKALEFTRSVHTPSAITESYQIGEPQGVVNPVFIRATFFVIFSIGLFITSAICILSVWDITMQDMAVRSVATFGILIVSLGLFTTVNEALASRVQLYARKTNGSKPSSPTGN